MSGLGGGIGGAGGGNSFRSLCVEPVLFVKLSTACRKTLLATRASGET